MERVRLALRISKIYCKRIERVNASKSFKRFFCEAGFLGGGGGGVGMNIRSFANKAVS